MIQKLLVPLDGSGFGEETLPYAAAIAKHIPAAVDVAHVHVPHPPDHLLSNTQYQYEGVDMDEYDIRDRGEKKEYLETIARRIEDITGREASTVLLTGTVVDALDSYTRGDGPGMIVMSTHGRTGLSRAWLGSVADGLVRHAVWPILLIRPRDIRRVERERRQYREFRRIFVPLDGSPRSESIVGPVLELATAMDSSVRLFRVVQPSMVVRARHLSAVHEALQRSTEYLECVAERFRGAGVKADVEVVDDPQPALAILEVVERGGADLVALATHGYKGIRRAILGSVADKVLRGVDIPLLLVGPGAEA